MLDVLFPFPLFSCLLKMADIRLGCPSCRVSLHIDQMSQANGSLDDETASSSHESGEEQIDVRGPTASYPPRRSTAPTSSSVNNSAPSIEEPGRESSQLRNGFSSVRGSGHTSVFGSTQNSTHNEGDRFMAFNSDHAFNDVTTGSDNLTNGHVEGFQGLVQSFTQGLIEGVQSNIVEAIAMRRQLSDDESTQRMQELLSYWLSPDTIDRMVGEREQLLASRTPRSDWRSDSLLLVGEASGMLTLFGGHAQQVTEVAALFRAMHAADINASIAEEDLAEEHARLLD